MKKNKIKYIGAALALLLAAFSPIPVSGREIGAPGWGELTHFNALLFRHYESVHGYMEGAMAVGGQAIFSSSSGWYEAGTAAKGGGLGRYPNPKGYPTLLLAGAPVLGTPYHGAVQVYGGPVVMGQEAAAAYESGGRTFGMQAGYGVSFAPQQELEGFFLQAYNRVKLSSRALSNSFTPQKEASAQVKLSDFVGWQTQAGFWEDTGRFVPDNLTTQSKLLVVLVTDGGHLEINGPQFTSGLEDWDMVVLSFPNAASVRFTGASAYVNGRQLNPWAGAGTTEAALLERCASRLVWHFPKAGTVQLAGTGLVGALLAPEAHVEGSGAVVCGMVTARSLYEGGGMWLNAFSPPEGLFGLENREEEIVTGRIRVVQEGEAPGPGQGLMLLSGAEYDLYRKRFGIYVRYNSRPYTTGRDGGFSVAGLGEGEYYLRQTKAPYGYEIDTERHSFSIDPSHGEQSSHMIRRYNALLRQDAMLRKVEAGQPEKGLGGGVFRLYDMNQGQIELEEAVTSDTEGYIRLGSLEYGHYRLVELTPPAGYEPVQAVVDVYVEAGPQGGTQVRYEENGTSLPTGPDGVPLLENQPARQEGTSRLVVLKVDADHPEIPLDDALFSLSKRVDGQWREVAAGLRTDPYGLLTVPDLEKGEYRLVETAPTPGYRAVEEEIYFHAAQSNIFHVVYNHAVGRIVVEKTDSTDPDVKLEGAAFALYYDWGNTQDGDSRIEEIDDGVTGEDGTLVFDGLRPGRYYLIQTAAPAGYRPLDEPELVANTVVSYLVDEQGGKIYYPEQAAIEVQRDPDYGYVVLHKVDGQRYDADPEANRAGLTGAAYDLYALDEAYQWKLFRQGVTIPTEAIDGRIAVGGLPYGNYKLVEVKAPQGYRLEEEGVLFSVLPDEGGSELLLRNQRVQSSREEVRGTPVSPWQDQSGPPVVTQDTVNPDTGK